MLPGTRRAGNKTQGWIRLIDELEKLKASLRAEADHPLLVIKRQFGHVRVRYRGSAKNTADLHTLFAQSNPRMARGQMGGVQARVRLQSPNAAQSTARGRGIAP